VSDDARIRGPREAVAGEDGDATASDPDVAEGLVSRLELIEGQPLGERAAAFALLHDELRVRLEGGDGAATYG
jgi:hypothetical protein